MVNRFGRKAFSMNSLKPLGDSEDPQVPAQLAGRRFLFNVDALKEKDTFDSGGQRRDPEIS